MDKRLLEPRTQEQWDAYARGEGEDWEYGEPDAENPELTEETAAWAVAAQDFDGDIHAVSQFLQDREALLASAEAVGIPRDAFLPFEPNKPGFAERAKVLLNLSSAEGWAAE